MTPTPQLSFHATILFLFPFLTQILASSQKTQSQLHSRKKYKALSLSISITIMYCRIKKCMQKNKRKKNRKIPGISFFVPIYRLFSFFNVKKQPVTLSRVVKSLAYFFFFCCFFVPYLKSPNPYCSKKPNFLSAPHTIHCFCCCSFWFGCKSLSESVSFPV